MDHPTKSEIYTQIGDCYAEVVELRKLAKQVVTARGELGFGSDGVAHWERIGAVCAALIECIKVSGLAEIRFQYAVWHPAEIQEDLPSPPQIL